MLKIKQILFRIFLLIIGLFISIVILEIIAGRYLKKARLDEKLKYIEDKLEHYHQPNIGCYDELLGWGFKPDVEDVVITSDFAVKYKINSKSLRDEEYNYEKKEDIYRIVALGESHTFAEGISFGKRYTEIIEKALHNVEVINMGVWGFGIDQALLYLEKEGFKYNPDLIILFINDPGIERCGLFWSGAYKPRFELDNSGKDLVLVKNYPEKLISNSQDIPNNANNNSHINSKKNSKIKVFFEKNSLLNFLKFNLYKSRVKEQLEEKDRLFWKQIRKDLSKARKASLYQKQLKIIIPLLLDRYLLDCMQHNAQFLIVNIDTNKLNLIEEYSRQKGVTYLDLSDTLRKAAAIRNLRFHIDPHYNEGTHQIIGEYVADYLKNEYNLSLNKDITYQFLGKF